MYTQLRAGVPPWLILFPSNMPISFGNHSSKTKDMTELMKSFKSQLKVTRKLSLREDK